MSNIRTQRAKWNIMVSFGSQIITLICGLIVPRLMIGTFGSEAYGATASIAQFLAYISLLEGGIGGVARAALYKPLAEQNMEQISAVISEIQRFFRVVAGIFVVYVLILAAGYHSMARVTLFDWGTTALLVVVISISTFAQYFIGISYAVLLQAAQKTYITQTINIMGTILNTIMVIILISLNCNLIIVKLFSSIVFALRPVLMRLYVRREYQLTYLKKSGKSMLEQKWTGLGQHIAYFLFSNTDIAVLTLFADLKTVAVYAVYNMVNYNMQNFALSFFAGAEALFGDMLAKEEYEELDRTFCFYETLMSFISIFLFGVTAALIVPFVKIYTKGIQDADYVAPIFAVILILSALLYCLRQPYHAVVIAAGHFKETRVSAYGEAVINILLSVTLVSQFGLIGVAIGTVISTTFRFVYYAFYLSGNIMHRRLSLFCRRVAVNAISFVLVFYPAYRVFTVIPLENYFKWAAAGAVTSVYAVVVMLGSTWIFYREDLTPLIRKILRK